MGDVPGLKSVPIATGTPASMNARAGAWWSFMRNQVVTGRRVATDRPASAAARHARRSRRRTASRGGPRVDAPISAASSAPPLGASSSACSRGTQPERGGRLRTRRDWSALNTPSSQNTSAATRPALGGHTGQLLVEEVADVRLGAIGPAAELRRHRVGPEPGRDDVDRTLLPEPVGDLEQAQLGREVEPVAGLRLDRRDAVAEHLVQPAPAVGGELLGRRGPGRCHGREDPAAGREDVEVARRPAGAARARPRATAGEEEMGVRVDEARA